MYYIFRRLIQTNHEYLADEYVTMRSNNIQAYQTLLLDTIEVQKQNPLASNLNFLITKKRLQMMTKKTSRHKALALRIGSMIVLCGMIFLYGEVTAQVNSTNQDKSQLGTKSSSIDKSIDQLIDKINVSHPNFNSNFPEDYPRLTKDEYFENSTIVYIDENAKEIHRKKYIHLSTKQRRAIPTPPPPPPPLESNDEVILKAEPEGTLVYFTLKGTIEIDGIVRPAGTLRIVRPGWNPKIRVHDEQ